MEIKKEFKRKHFEDCFCNQLIYSFVCQYWGAGSMCALEK